jgi:NAD(P)-dependent dehydrogenase (short-subunit alcohol dehydrogenase family)/uncharacterized OB-fold protein
MRRPPMLPPRARGPMARRLSAAAARGAFELPFCEACGTAQYPLRERCGRCCSGRIVWRPASPMATLLAQTIIRHSTEPYFQSHRPIALGSVQLDDGPVALAFLAKGCGPAGSRVRILNQLDRAGEAVLVAVASAADNEDGANVMTDPNREIAGKVVLVTGANGGIGRELVAAFRNGGAAEVIEVGGPTSSGSMHPLDVTDRATVEALAAQVAGRVDILVNNAGYNANAGALFPADGSLARREMDVNYFGLLNMIQAFAPAMRARGQGVIVNILSILSLVNLPAIGSYCASKAAAWSFTQAARAELAPWGVRVCGVLPGAVDTRMSAATPPPKLAPQQLAGAVLKAIRDGVEDVYPGAMAERVFASMREDAKTVEKEMSARLPG